MKQMTRRNFLKGTAAAAALLSAGGLFRAVEQGVFSTGQGPAYAAWRNWNTGGMDGDSPFLPLVQAAVLASSAHNTQPWLFRITDRKLLLYADVSRNLGAMDPALRELYLSLGCALENILLTADAYGYQAETVLHTGGMENILCASIGLEQGSVSSASSGLYQAIGSRSTNRGAYDMNRPVKPQTREELEHLGQAMPDVRVVWHAEPGSKEEMGQLITAATEAIIADGKQAAASHRWYRQDWNEVQRHKDGPTMDATGNGAFTRFLGKLLPVSMETSNRYWLTMTRNLQVPTAGVFGTIAVKNRTDRTQLLAAGRLWQRMHLWACANGLAMQPLNQPHERRDRELQLGLPAEYGGRLDRLLGVSGFEGVFTFRAGYPKEQALLSPRRPAEEVLLG